MKTLVLVRHAKSDWDDSSLSDFDRPLSKRGIIDAPFMAELLDDLGVKPDYIISSAANRALTTARIFGGHFKLSEKNIKEESAIYGGNYRTYINSIIDTDNSINTLFVFGHNPEISIVSSQLLQNFYDQIPTCGCICIDFDVDDWAHIESGKSKLRFFEYPRKNK